MKKIPTLFLRDASNPKLVTRSANPDASWVLEGEGVATEKFDGSACLVRGGRLYKRHALKAGKTMPAGWMHHSFNPEQTSGHGWAPVDPTRTSDQYHVEALESESRPGEEGTYELVGPRVQRNPYALNSHALWRHGSVAFTDVPRSFDGLERWLSTHHLEGLVFHHEDGRMAKVKRRDFGIPWPGVAR